MEVGIKVLILSLGGYWGGCYLGSTASRRGDRSPGMSSPATLPLYGTSSQFLFQGGDRGGIIPPKLNLSPPPPRKNFTLVSKLNYRVV